MFPLAAQTIKVDIKFIYMCVNSKFTIARVVLYFIIGVATDFSYVNSFIIHLEQKNSTFCMIQVFFEL